MSTAGACALLLSIAPLAGAQNPPAAKPAPAPPAPSAAAPVPAAPPAPEPLTNDQASYLFGLNLGESLHSIGIAGDVSSDSLMRGVKEGLKGKTLTPPERQQVQMFVRAKMTALAESNKAAATDYLQKNAQKKGVQSTASGLQYKVIKAGDASAPAVAPTDEVTVNYRGRLIDGTEFDSSYSHGMPATFPVNGVIRGWQEALQLMKPGAQWVLYVPPELAYGPAPRPGIPANSLLIFDVELLSVKPRPAAAPAPPASPNPMMRATPTPGQPPPAAPKPPTGGPPPASPQ